jgi:(4S)-4-hydroxy-5-phosphonooxypentane-2,3-dione isomerase
MYAVCVTIKVKPEAVQAFTAAIRLNHEGSVQEPGCLRFDVLQAENDPAHFFLYEIYRQHDDFLAHQQTAHYAAWKAAIADMMAEPRVGLRFVTLFPTDAQWLADQP